MAAIHLVLQVVRHGRAAFGSAQARGDIVVWAILVLPGVPLWLCATAILLLVFRNRGLRQRAADIPMG